MPLVYVAEGLSLKECLHRSETSEVYLAMQEDDGQELVLKAYRQGQEESAEPRVNRELEVLQRLAGPGVPRGLSVLPGDGDARPTLVAEYVPGILLKAWAESTRVSADAFLEVALQLALVLTRVHVARLIHRDLSTANVIVDPQTLKTHLIDFGLTRPLGASLQTSKLHSIATGVGTLVYISPEQTGRMDRGVDSRSDLYSLGACLYHALTGRPPFLETDPLALIHAHFAKVPVPPSEIRPELPSTLSRIVLRLLHKSPEDRYQTADALHVDLSDCRRQLRERGSIADDMLLGTADVPHRPLFSSKLYGRDREMHAVRTAFARAASGRPTVALISGAPGVGKSALTHALRGPLAERSGRLVRGKFDAYRPDRQYAGFSQAISALVDQLLTESDAALLRWSEELARALGAIAAALFELAPNLELVLQEVPPLPTVEHAAARARLILAVQRLLRSFAKPEHPLVLVLDDLQWADEASRDLLREVLFDPEASALLVLAIYRESDVGETHPLTRVLSELIERGISANPITLSPLTLEPCAEMLSAALGRSSDATRGLAACVGRKTGSAPLLIQQFVYHMYDLGLIHYEAGIGWTWDDVRIEAADIPENAVALMTAKLGRLSAALAESVQLASCAGDVFDVDTLAELSRHPREQLEAALFQLCDEGLLAPAPAGFRFAHDRIREAARALLSEEDRARLHCDAGMLLLARVPAAAVPDRVFEIVDHLNHGTTLLEPDLLPRALELNLMAGKQALTAGASGTASAYFGEARSLRERMGCDDPGLSFDLLFHSVEAAYQQRDFELGRTLLDELDRLPLVRMQSALVSAKRISIEQLAQTGESVLPLVIENLARFGVRWPRAPSWLRTRAAILHSDWLLRRPIDDRLLRPTSPPDHARWAPVILIIAAGSGAFSVNSIRHTTLACSFILRTYLTRGYIMPPALLLAGYAAFRLSVLRHLRGADRYARAALEWADSVPHVPFSARARYVVHAFVEAWTKPRRSVLEPLRMDCEALMEFGDLEYAYYAALQRTGYLALCGEPLANVRREYQALGVRMHRSTELQVSALESLQDPKANVSQLLTDVRALQLASDSPADDAMQAWAFWLGILCVFGQHTEAVRISESIRWRVREVGATVSQLVDHAFFGALAASAAAGTGIDRRHARRIVSTQLRQIRTWARIGPDFRHMESALTAASAHLRGHHPLALERYKEAARAATRGGYRHHAALLHERRGELLSQLGRNIDARQALRDAADLYSEWGAHAKVTQLRSKANAMGLRID